jgi:hypothetical protein
MAMMIWDQMIVEDDLREDVLDGFEWFRVLKAERTAAKVKHETERKRQASVAAATASTASSTTTTPAAPVKNTSSNTSVSSAKDGTAVNAIAAAADATVEADYRASKRTLLRARLVLTSETGICLFTDRERYSTHASASDVAPAKDRSNDCPGASAMLTDFIQSIKQRYSATTSGGDIRSSQLRTVVMDPTLAPTVQTTGAQTAAENARVVAALTAAVVGTSVPHDIPTAAPMTMTPAPVSPAAPEETSSDDSILEHKSALQALSGVVSEYVPSA